AGYTSPAQKAITADLKLSLAEYALFSSTLTFDTMIGEIASGSIADFVGCKGVSYSRVLE
nr:sugar transporter ERD6-like 7 [Tanacetum cinerariifolium]